MSLQILAGITHAVVTVPNKVDATETGVRAVVDFCYGPGDDTAICQVRLVKGEDGLVWRVPHVPVTTNGRQTMVPVFRGLLLIKLCESAARAVDHIRRDCGTPQYGTRYRVCAGDSVTVQVIDDRLAA